MRNLLPLLCYGGLSCAIYIACLVPLSVATMLTSVPKEKKTADACFTMIFFGIGSIIGA